MASISKSQADLLADGFLDDLGSSADEIKPKETISEIILLAGEMAIDMQENLERSNRTDTGALSESITVLDPIVTADGMQVDISMNFYGLFVNKGVKGTKSGSKAPGSHYKFKHDMPSRSHVDAIREWIKSSGLKTNSKDVQKYGAYGKHEKKQKSISELDSAFAAARKIKMYGLKKTGFLDKAAKSTEDKVQQRLGEAFRIDIINALDV